MKEFIKDDCRIFLGDAIEVLDSRIQDTSIDLIFADPPYNIGKTFASTKDKWTSNEEYLNWCYKWIDICLKKLKDNGSIYLMTSTQFMPYFDLYVREKVEVLSRIVWSYDSSGVQAKNYFGSLYEPILFCVKDKNNYTFNSGDIMVEAKTGSKRKLIDYRKPIPTVYNSIKVPGNVWNINRIRYRMDEYENHPTQKPEELLKRIILASSNKGETVLDPFAGTFTTCNVAKKLGRKSIGIDIAEEYVKIGLRRLGIDDSFDGKLLVKQNQSYQTKNENQLSLFTEDNELWNMNLQI